MVSDKETIFYWVLQQGKVLLVSQIMTESVWGTLVGTTTLEEMKEKMTGLESCMKTHMLVIV
jgi:hypothetical protein